MLQLHYFPGNASLIPHLVLEELGVPFELKYVDRARRRAQVAGVPGAESERADPGAGRSPRRRRDGQPLVLYETAAVCMHLADTHPVAGLLPPLGTAERAQAYKWLAWLSNTVQAALILYFYPERWGDEPTAAQVKAQRRDRRSARCSTSSTPSSRATAGRGCSATRFSVCDPYAFVLCRWTRGFARPARSLPHLQPFLTRMLERPAVQRAFATEGLKPPLV